MKQLANLLMAGVLLIVVLVSCEDGNATCEKACGIMDDLCNVGEYMDDCLESCAIDIADQSDELIETVMTCLEAAESCEAAFACTGGNEEDSTVQLD